MLKISQSDGAPRGSISLKIIFLLVLFCQFALSQNLIKGPYIQNIQQNQATVCWVTQESAVSFGTKSTALKQQSIEFKVHETILKDLQPDKIYYYNIGFGKMGQGQFRSAPEPGTPFRFVVVGDTRFAEKPRAIQRTLISAIENQQPALVVNTGDLVTSGLNPVHWDTFFEMNKNLIKSVPYYVSLGNHEKNSPYFYQYFSYPEKENYFSFDWSNCHFIILDSSGPYENPEHPLSYQERKAAETAEIQFWDQQIEWLCNDLKNHQDSDFIFVFMHQPLYSLKESRRREQKDFQRMFADIFDSYQVDIVFSGHDHTYQRHYVNPVQYVVTAGGGAGLYACGKPFVKYTRKAISIHHYVIVEVSGNQLKVTALTEKDQLIDQFTIPYNDREHKKRAEQELRLKEVGTYDTYY